MQTSIPPLAATTLGRGDPLVLFHGGMGSRNHWIRNLDALAEHFLVHAVDLPGYGESFAVEKTLPQEDYADCLTEALGPIVGKGAFRLAGFSLGAVLAAMIATRLPEQVLKLALLGVGGFGPSPRLPMQPIPPQSAGEDARRAVFRHNLGVLMFSGPEAVTDEALELHAANVARTRYDGRGHANGCYTAAALPRLHCPVLFLYGERDILHVHHFEAHRARIRGLHPEAGFQLVPGAGHWVQYEAPAETNRRLLDFLSG